MSNVYQLSNHSATENFIIPQKLLDFIATFPRGVQSAFESERNMLGDLAFYKKTSDLVSYQLFIGILDLKNVSGRNEFWEFYNQKREPLRAKRFALFPAVKGLYDKE